jgi:dienelactone hydrolase
LRSAAVLGLVVACVAAQPPQKPREVAPFLDEFQPGKLHELPLFLDQFAARNEPALRTEKVTFFEGAPIGFYEGFWVRAEGKQPLPAILLAYDDNDNSLAPWMQTNARHLASIGYAVLAVPVYVDAVSAKGGRRLQTQLSACMRWLRTRAEVSPNRLGVVAFGASGQQALLFASSRAVQACVVCDAPLPMQPDVIRGLRGTPVLVVHGADERRPRQDVAVSVKQLTKDGIPCKLHLAPGAQAGFLGPPGSKTYSHDAAEDAWVAIYNFLEKHVEDAKPAEVVARSVKSALTIADMMRAVNEPSGVRGTLSQALDKQPKTTRQWGQVRAQAALIEEMGAWLQSQTPPKGPAGHWQEQAQAYSKAATAIVDAAQRRDYAAAKLGLTRLAGQCAACHNEHR